VATCCIILFSFSLLLFRYGITVGGRQLWLFEPLNVGSAISELQEIGKGQLRLNHSKNSP